MTDDTKRTTHRRTLPGNAIRRLEELSGRTGVPSDGEVVRQALRVYEAINGDGVADKDTPQSR